MKKNVGDKIKTRGTQLIDKVAEYDCLQRKKNSCRDEDRL